MKTTSDIACMASLTLAAVLLAVGTWAAHHAPFRQDRHHFEYMGECLLAGRTLYVDCWDNKPPLLAWTTAGVLAAGRHSSLAVTIAGGLLAAVTTGCVALGAWKCLGPGTACAVAVVAAATLGLRYYDGCTFGMDQYTAAIQSIAALAFVFTCRTRGTAAVLWAIACGVAFGAAIATKQFAVAAPAAILLTTAAAFVQAPRLRSAIADRLAAGLGGLAGVIAFVTWLLWRQGTLDEAWFAIVTVNRLYVQSGQAWGLSPASLYEHRHRLIEQLVPALPLFWFAALGVIATWTARHRRNETALPGGVVVVLSVWLLLAAFAVVCGPAHHARYWHMCFVPALWLAAQALYFLIREAAARPGPARTVIILSGLTVAWLLVQPAARQQYSDLMSTPLVLGGQTEEARLGEIASRIVARTASSDEIYVWGYDPGIYRFSERFAPTRFSGTDYLSFGRPVQWMANEIINALNARQPQLILMPDGGIPKIDGIDTTSLQELLDRAYAPAETVGGYTFLARKPSHPATTTSTSQPASAATR